MLNEAVAETKNEQRAAAKQKREAARLAVGDEKRGEILDYPQSTSVCRAQRYNVFIDVSGTGGGTFKKDANAKTPIPTAAPITAPGTE
jgi:hypothetical protein